MPTDTDQRNRLWWATLSLRSPRYQTWLDILGTNEVPLKSARLHAADLGPEKDVEVYLLDLAKFDQGQRWRLIEWIGSKFGASRGEIEGELDQVGFPIRAEDVTVAFDMRAFL